MYVSMWIYRYSCVCVCVCVCAYSSSQVFSDDFSTLADENSISPSSENCSALGSQVLFFA